jgi:hypothetical protein
MSIVSQIELALALRADIALVGVSKIDCFPSKQGPWSYLANFYIAPRLSLYCVEALQTLLRSIIPNIEPCCQSEFKYVGVMMSCGMMCFSEVVGTEKLIRKFSFTDESGVNEILCTHGVKTNLLRRIALRMYPSVLIAEDARLGKRVADLSSADIESYRQRESDAH